MFEIIQAFMNTLECYASAKAKANKHINMQLP